MKTIATPLSHRRLGSASSLIVRLPDFIELTKPRVMMLAVFTALVGLSVAPSELDQWHAIVAVLAIAGGAGAAGALNMWFDADIDALMARTAMRPIPRGRVSKREAVGFGLALAAFAVLLLASAANLVAASLLGGAIFFYIIVYTVWLKRSTPHNIVIGGAAGALPPVIGWTASTGRVDLEPVVLFLIIFLWTPPHFWALALNRAHEYEWARVPMLPVVRGRETTKRQILIYSALVALASTLPFILGFAGAVYAAAAALCGATLVALAIRLAGARGDDQRAARRLFAFSIAYLFTLFAALLVDHARAPGPRIAAEHAARNCAVGVYAELASGGAARERESSSDMAGEV